MPFGDPHNSIAISLVWVIVDRDCIEKVLSVVEKQRSFFNLASLGKGTANSRILSYFGIGQSDKTVLFCIMPSLVAAETMQHLNEKLELSKPGHGIAFCTEVREGCYHKLVQFEAGQNGGETVEQTAMHDLILLVVNRGYTEEVMDVARRAGATGGTVLHARGCGLVGAEKFFGVTIQPEKEVIMMVAGKDVSCGIMGAVAAEAGPGTDASAISFSVPLSGVFGLGENIDE